MSMQDMLDLYTDYLLSSSGQASATGLSRLVDGAISHDSITCFLSSNDFGSRELWQKVKPMVRQHEKDEGCLIFDDTIVEKSYTDENDMISRHWDHSKKRSVKGINLLNAFYHVSISSEEDLRIPVGFEITRKTVRFCDLKTKKEKRVSPVTKNEMMQLMIAQ